MRSAHFDAAEARPAGLRAAGRSSGRLAKNCARIQSSCSTALRGVAGLELRDQSPNASPPADAGTPPSDAVT
jgi:hypothetical protein